jgi:hypothetical protein
MIRIFNFFRSLVFLLLRLARQKWYLRRVMPELEARFRHNTDGTLSKSLQKKMRFYAELMPTIVGDTCCLLRGIPISTHEREMQSYLAIFTPIFDEWFDNQRFESQKIREFLFSPHQFSPQNDFEKLTLDVLKRLHALAPKHIAWTEIAQNLDEAQSHNQRQTQLTTNDLRLATYNKGGYSFWLIRLFLEHPLSKNEEKAVMQFGFLIQYIDDIFDIREDHLDGTRTLATESTEMADLDADYRAELARLFDFLSQTDFLPKHQKQFRRVIMVLFSMGFIALRQLKIAQNKYGGAFDANKLTRQELVCDFEKWRNWAIWVRVYQF